MHVFENYHKQLNVEWVCCCCCLLSGRVQNYLPKWPEQMLERFQNSQLCLCMSVPKNIRQETWYQVDTINRRILNTRQHISECQISLTLCEFLRQVRAPKPSPILAYKSRDTQCVCNEEWKRDKEKRRKKWETKEFCDKILILKY